MLDRVKWLSWQNLDLWLMNMVMSQGKCKLPLNLEQMEYFTASIDTRVAMMTKCMVHEQNQNMQRESKKNATWRWQWALHVTATMPYLLTWFCRQRQTLNIWTWFPFCQCIEIHWKTQLLSSNFGLVTDRQTHMSPSCSVHRWAQKSGNEQTSC